MNSYTIQVIISQKLEAIDESDVLQYALTVKPTDSANSGLITITSTDIDADIFFVTGNTYDVTITPHVD